MFRLREKSRRKGVRVQLGMRARGEDGRNGPGNPPSALRSQRTCLVGCGACCCLVVSASSCVLGVGVVEEDVVLLLMRVVVVGGEVDVVEGGW